MYYETYGSGIPVLALHGFGLDHRVMTGCLEPVFTGRPGYQRIYPDLPGMGRTPPAAGDRPANADEMLDLLLAFVDRTIRGPFLLAGNSYGGYLARGLVRRRPEQVAGLLLICPVVFPKKARRTVPAHRVLYQDRELLSTLTEKEAADFQQYAVVQSRYTWERMKSDVLSGQALADEAFLSRYGERGYGFSFDVDALRSRSTNQRSSWQAGTMPSWATKTWPPSWTVTPGLRSPCWTARATTWSSSSPSSSMPSSASGWTGWKSPSRSKSVGASAAGGRARRPPQSILLITQRWRPVQIRSHRFPPPWSSPYSVH